jgi:hypothetical protein
MIPPRWRNASAFVTSARQCVVHAQFCCPVIRVLHISFVPSVRLSATPAPESVRSSAIWRRCGNVPRHAVAVPSPAGKLPNLVLFERLRKDAEQVQGDIRGKRKRVQISCNGMRPKARKVPSSKPAVLLDLDGTLLDSVSSMCSRGSGLWGVAGSSFLSGAFTAHCERAVAYLSTERRVAGRGTSRARGSLR